MDQAARPASMLEVVAARGWNLLNEGKAFHPIFVLGVHLLYVIIFHGERLREPWSFILALAATVPVLAVYTWYDFPLHLRAALWIPLLAWVSTAGLPAGGWTLLVLAVALYFTFTVGLWGTIYYHLRTGTPLDNYKRFWRLVLENSDSTSGNAGEQVPKFLLALSVLEWASGRVGTGAGAANGLVLAAGTGFGVLLGAYAWAVHRWLFTWRPQPRPDPVRGAVPAAFRPLKRAFVVVIDGCRRDKLGLADTPFLDELAARGTVHTRLETDYPARTVVCFSSMLTGAGPAVHGMRSNLVLSLGVKCESIFDSLRRSGRKGILLGCAHLVDAFGPDCRTFTAVAHNDRVDAEILARAREIIAAESPDLFVVQLISADQTGHARGVHFPEYLDRIAETDRLIAQFHGWLTERGLLDESAFIVMADHGQSRGIGGHGHLDEGERFVPFLAAGAGIARGRIIEEPGHIRSLAPTLAMLLGIEPPREATAPPLTGLLASTTPPVRREKLTVIFPAHNEADTVGEMVRRVPRCFAPGLQVEVLVVDDGSTDGTGAVAAAAGAGVVIRWPRNRGLGAGVRAGLQRAYRDGADYAVFLDADGEYPPEAIPDLVAPLRLGEADYVVGSRFRGYIRRMRWIRRLGNRCLTLALSALLRRWVTDGQSGMRALNRRALSAFNINHDYNYAQVLTVNLLRQGFRYAEVPITYACRPDGRSFVRLGPYLRHVVPALWRELRGRRPGRPRPLVSEDTVAD